MPDKYVGRPWRARYLRAPKAALQLDSRTDFVPLGELASVSLGLKTGADRFFFLTPLQDGGRRARLLLGEAAGLRTVVRVRGYADWEGDVPARDLLPAIRNPHELFSDDARLFKVPASLAAYLFPRDRDPSGDLASYIRVGERDGLPKLDLVKSNASKGRWYRQARANVRSAWLLPYNSAYDYGAWDNADRAVLNGRFVGVDPFQDVDPELLGAALNSTWVMASRLLEGVSTGSEGAFDVGPPAARLMAVPDIRRAVGSAAEDARAAVREMRDTNSMPPGPDSRGHVQEVRRCLDLALLCSLGSSLGEASAELGRLYEGYARWRRAVENVESIVRVNRSRTRRQGQGRGISPTQLAARSVWETIAPGCPIYPRDFLLADDELEVVVIRGKLAGSSTEPLFDPGIVPGPEGPIDLGSWDRVRFAAMLAEIGFHPPFLIPVNRRKAATLADGFDTDRQAFLELATRTAREIAPAASVDDVVAGAQALWFRACRASGMGTSDAQSGATAIRRPSSASPTSWQGPEMNEPA